MKKILLSVFVFAQLTFAFGQTCKYDHHTYKIVHAAHSNSELTPLLVQGNVALINQKIQQFGGVVKFSAGDITSVYLPQNKIGELLQFSFVKRVESTPSRAVPMNDTMRMNANVNEIHNGLLPLPQAYTGSNVVTGFIDTGVDFTHPDFKNTNGTSRIAWLWDHAKPNAPNTPQPYNYGQEWSAADLDAGLSNHSDAPHYGHGTLSTGITAGNGLATGFNQGVAPDADIIMVAFDFNSSQPNRIADGVNYIFTKAAAMGKPCVINASLGDYYGSHDGKDLEAQLIDNLLSTQNGRLMVAAAGNKGDDSIHVVTNVVPGDTSWTWYKYDPAFGVTYIEAWADDADMQNIQFAIGADSNTTSASFIGRTPFINFNSILGTQVAYAVPGTTDTVLVAGDSYAGRSQLIVQVNTSNPTFVWRLMSKGQGTFDVWHIVFQNYNSGIVKINLPPASVVPEIVNYVMPDLQKNVINSFGCSDNVITVGNYLNKNSNVDCSDTLRFNSPDTPGVLANNSGKGPTRDGRQKPEIAAPGNYIMAALVLSTDTATAITNKRINKGCYHKVAGGTSAAAPVVTGVGALYLQKNPTATPLQFRNAIINCGHKADTFTGANLPDNKWGYGKIDAFHTLTGCLQNINDISDLNIGVAVMPNPFSDFTTFNIYFEQQPKNLSVSVYDILGKKVAEINQQDFSFTAKKAEAKLPKAQLNAGLYFYTVKFDNAVAANGKLMVQ